MKPRSLWLLAALGCLGASTALANQTDLRTVETQVFQNRGSVCTTLAPVVGSSTCLKVAVQNLGPDPYQGTVANMAKPTGGTLNITVDIDEPTKPTSGPLGLATFHISRDFVVNIGVGATAVLDFGPVSYVPATQGTHLARATATIVSGTNSDPNPANNQAQSPFTVGAQTPATGRLGLVVLAAGLVIGGAWWLRRKGERA